MKVQNRVDLFIKKYNFKPQAFEICPKWEHCSCNKCPIHKDFVKLQSAPEDHDRKCCCPKRIRKEIGVYFKLKNMGLRERELNGVKLSLQIQKQSLITREKIPKTPQIAHIEPNSDASSHKLLTSLPEGELSPSGFNYNKLGGKN